MPKYLCDPKKNTACKKRNCYANTKAVERVCRYTTNPVAKASDKAAQAALSAADKPDGKDAKATTK